MYFKKKNIYGDQSETTYMLAHISLATKSKMRVKLDCMGNLLLIFRREKNIIEIQIYIDREQR